jgi:hypothetical protein
MDRKKGVVVEWAEVGGANCKVKRRIGRMSDIDLVVRISKSLEARLVRDFGADGEGLGKKIESVERKLPSETVKQLYEVNKVRNDLVHKEELNTLTNRNEFKRKCKNIERSLNKVKRANRPPEWEGGVVVIGFMMITLIIYFLFQNLL